MKNVSLSKDGRSLSFYSNFFSKKFEKTETTYISADREACIYNFKLKEDTHGPITITGCKNEVREMSIFPTNSPPLFSKIYPKGKVEEIVLPPVKDQIIFPEHLPNNKTKESGGKNVNNKKQTTNTPAQGSDNDHQASTKDSDEFAKHDNGRQTKHGDKNKKSSISTKESVEKPVDRSAERINKRRRQRKDNEKQTTSTTAQGSDKDHHANNKGSDEFEKHGNDGQTKIGDINKKSSTGKKLSVEKPALKTVDRSAKRIDKRQRQRTNMGKIHNADSLVSQEANSED